MGDNTNSIKKSMGDFPLKQFDIESILKASIAISEQLQPEQLAKTLMQIIMQESGADKGYLLLEQKGQLSVFAESTVKKKILTKIYFTPEKPDYNFLPEKIIQSVRNTSEKIIIDDVSNNKEYESDNYFLTAHPKSIACIPILREKKNIAIIYLENNLSTHIFTPDKMDTITILGTHSAVTFENMILSNKLNLSKKSFQDIMDNTTAVIFAKRLNGSYLFVNDEFEKLYKIPKENVINLTDYDIFPKEFADSFVAKDKVILETKKPFTYEEKIPHDKGMRIYIITKFPLLDSEGVIYAVAGIATDITDMKRLEESLRENQSRFNYVLAATQDSIYDWDIETGRIWRNEQYEKLFDGPMGPDLAWWRHNLHPEEFEDVIKKLEDAFSRHDQLWNQEYRFKRVKEGYAYVIDRGYILYNQQGKPVRMIGALLDISERRKQQEAEKTKTLQRLYRQEELFKLTNFRAELSLNEKLNTILATSAKVLEVERLSICFFNKDEAELTSSTTYSLSQNSYLSGVTFKKNDYPRFFYELGRNRNMDVNNIIDDPRTLELVENYLKPLGIVSLMATPIRTSEKVIGVILHEHVGQKRIWSYEEQTFAYSIADIVTLAVENEEKLKITNTLIESEQLFRIAISQLPILFAVFDTNLKWTMAGGKILEKLGLKAETLLGRTVFQTNDTIDTNITNHKAALDGKSSSYEYNIGQTVLQRFLEPLQNAAGKIVGVISMSIDITERKKMELEIIELKRKLELCEKESLRNKT